MNFAEVSMNEVYNALTELDKKRIENFIFKFGVPDYLYAGTEKYFKEWGEEKSDLFKLLGNSLIYETSIEFNKTHNQLRKEVTDLMIAFGVTLKKIEKYLKLKLTSKEFSNFYYYLLDVSALEKNKVELTYPKEIVFTRKDKSNLVISNDSKVLKAIIKVFKYYDMPKELLKEFEEFRIGHSMILNNKRITGTLCLSIHPLDFMTMSDNANNWSSCLSWAREGCYRAGTIEMLNSKNVLIAYIKGENTYYFDDGDKSEEKSWNSKKYRQLFVVDKDILLSGKSYPYASSETSLNILNILKKLAEDNCSWKYAGAAADRYVIPEYWKECRDSSMPASSIIRIKTNRMYNDFLNDVDRKYYCFISEEMESREEIVDKNISGTAACLSTLDTIGDLEYRNSYDYYEEDMSYQSYRNHRYGGCSRLVSNEVTKKHRCYNCGEIHLFDSYEINGKTFCKECAKNTFALDPISNKPFYKYDCGEVARPVKERYGSIYTDESGESWSFEFFRITEENIENLLESGDLIRKKYYISRGLFNQGRREEYIVTSPTSSIDWNIFLAENLRHIDLNNFKRI